MSKEETPPASSGDEVAPLKEEANIDDKKIKKGKKDGDGDSSENPSSNRQEEQEGPVDEDVTIREAHQNVDGIIPSQYYTIRLQGVDDNLIQSLIDHAEGISTVPDSQGSDLVVDFVLASGASTQVDPEEDLYFISNSQNSQLSVGSNSSLTNFLPVMPSTGTPPPGDSPVLDANSDAFLSEEAFSFNFSRCSQTSTTSDSQ